MICASTDDVVLCTTRRVSTEVAMPTAASALSRDVVTPHATDVQAISNSPAAHGHGHANVNANTGFQDDSLRRYELKLDDLLSVRSSIVSTGSMSDLKRDLRHTGVATSRMAASAASAASSPSSTGSGVAFAPQPKSRLEDKIKMIAHYIRSLSMGLKHRHHNHHSHNHASQADDSSSSSGHRRHRLHKNEKDPHETPVMIKRRSQVSLSQYSQPRSAPDVLDAHNQKKSRANDASGNSSDMTVRCSSSSQQTSLSWDEICGGGTVLVEENEVMPARPARRKRGRRCAAAAAEQYDEAELRLICEQCDVPAHNVDDLVTMVRRHFGTCQFDVTVCHELTRGNSVVLIGMLVFGCIVSRDDTEELLLLDLPRLPAFLRHIQSRYNDENPFHNACHAADVLHSLFMMLWTTQLGQRVAVHNQIGVLFAAIMHDVEHIGLTNDFLVQTNHEIAVKYATRAPMEEMHLTLAVEMLTDPTFDVLAKMSNDQQHQVLEIVKETIRSTALCYQKELLRDVADVAKEDWMGDETHDTADRVLPLKTQTIALRIAMHVSDISQTMKPFAIHTKWVARLNEELFLQGDLDQRLQLGVCGDSCYRDKWTQVAFLKSQVWFLRNFALPAAQGFNSIPWLHATILEDNLHANIAQWDAQLTTALLA